MEVVVVAVFPLLTVMMLTLIALTRIVDRLGCIGHFTLKYNFVGVTRLVHRNWISNQMAVQGLVVEEFFLIIGGNDDPFIVVVVVV